MIPPTIGRKVWFTPAKIADPRFDKTQPLDATICYVHNQHFVNLSVRHQTGEIWSGGCEHVLLLQESDERPEQGRYAEWMPYQIGQAKK